MKICEIVEMKCLEAFTTTWMEKNEMRSFMLIVK